nr:C615 [uncultured bacterium]ART37218.1 D469 [uncultured bacterium]
MRGIHGSSSDRELWRKNTMRPLLIVRSVERSMIRIRCGAASVSRP